MRKQERKVLENAITTINLALNYAIEKEDDFMKIAQVVE